MVPFQNYILYRDSKDLVVTSKYKRCKNRTDNLCNCAVYMRIDDKNPKYAFIDFCYSNPNTAKELKYFDNDLIQKGVLNTGDFPLLNCNKTISNEWNEKEWLNVSLYQRYFQCAKLITSQCETYLV